MMKRRKIAYGWWMVLLMALPLQSFGRGVTADVETYLSTPPSNRTAEVSTVETPQPDPQQEFLVVSGTITDLRNRSDIPDAHIQVEGSNQSTLSNADGFFALKVQKKPRALIISAIGYRNVRYVLKPTDNPQKLSIALAPMPNLLSNVTVYSPENIVQSAIQKIESNYSPNPESFSTFYRETIRKKNRYVNLSEAVLEMYKTGYDEQVEWDQVKILKGRKLISQRAKDTLAIKIMGGPSEALVLDLVKNRDYFLNEGEMNCYYWNMEDEVSINDRPQYVIGFRPRLVMEHPLYMGRMYIDKELLSFTRIECSLDVHDQAKATRFMLVQKPNGLRFKPRELTTYVHYHFDGQVSRLSYIRNVYRFDCDWKKRGASTSYTCVSEMVVTDYQQVQKAPSRKGTFKQRDILDSKVNDFDDPAFWENYNIIPPSESLEKAVKKLKKWTK